MQILNALILDPIITRTVSFLETDIGVEVLKQPCIEYLDKLEPYPTTAMIGLGGSINLMFLMSFDDSSINKMIHQFVYGEINPGEIHELREGVACEIANTVLGNALVNLPNQGNGVTITPPIMLACCKTISKNPISIITAANINTNCGNLVLALIGQEVSNI